MHRDVETRKGSVLLTGATGFVGHACRRVLRAEGWDIHATTSGTVPTIATDDGVVWHQVDALNRQAMANLLDATRPSHLLHLAWHIAHGEGFEALANDIWQQATAFLIEDFAAVGGQRAVLTGTCAEYDWTTHGVYREDDDTRHAATRYGRAKADTNRASQARAARVGLSRAWARPFFIYGPGEPAGKLAASVIRALASGDDALVSHGRQVRDFVYVNDVAGALVRLLSSDIDGAINLASGQPTPLAAVVNEIALQLGVPDRVRFGVRPSPRDEPPLIVADVTRLRVELGFEPSVDLAEGIRRSIAWWQSQPANGSSER